MTFSRAAASLSAPDYILMQRLNRWRPPRWIRVWMLAATRAGDGWLWWCCGIAVESSGNAAKDHALSAAALAVVTGIASLVVAVFSFASANWVGAGICLVSAALAFGLVANALLRH